MKTTVKFALCFGSLILMLVAERFFGMEAAFNTIFLSLGIISLCDIIVNIKKKDTQNLVTACLVLISALLSLLQINCFGD